MLVLCGLVARAVKKLCPAATPAYTAWVEVLSSRDAWWMAECDAALLAEGIPLLWIAHTELADVHILEVPLGYEELTCELLSGQLGEVFERRRSETPPPKDAHVPWYWRPAVATGLGLAACVLVFYAITGSTAAHGPWQVRGALLTERALAGHQWWRLVTAATLHADGAHALSNASFFVALAWAAGERLGSGVMLAAWLCTAVVGFMVSLLTSDTSLTVGASGGLYGLLGAAGGHALWAAALYHEPRRRRMQVAGAATMLLAFTAFSEHANWHAHVGGFVAGTGVGLVAGRFRKPRAWAQAAVALASVGMIVAAWARAWA